MEETKVRYCVERCVSDNQTRSYGVDIECNSFFPLRWAIRISRQIENEELISTKGEEIGAFSHDIVSVIEDIGTIGTSIVDLARLVYTCSYL